MKVFGVIATVFALIFFAKFAFQDQEDRTIHMDKVILNIIEVEAPAPSLEDDLPSWAFDEMSKGDAEDVK